MYYRIKDAGLNNLLEFWGVSLKKLKLSLRDTSGEGITASLTCLEELDLVDYWYMSNTGLHNLLRLCSARLAVVNLDPRFVSVISAASI